MDRVKETVIGVLTKFFQEEVGNRVTPNNMEGLGMKMLKALDELDKSNKESKPDSPNPDKK